MSKIKCPKCSKSSNLKRTRYRTKTNTIKRYFECSKCQFKFSTIEMMSLDIRYRYLNTG